MKRYILSFDDWNKRLNKILGIIGKARKKGKGWSDEVSEKEMRRLIISGNHHIRLGYRDGVRMKGIVKLWVDETGKIWPLRLLIKPPPF